MGADPWSLFRESQGYSLGAILPPSTSQGILATSVEIFGCHNWGKELPLVLAGGSQECCRPADDAHGSPRQPRVTWSTELTMLRMRQGNPRPCWVSRGDAAAVRKQLLRQLGCWGAGASAPTPRRSCRSPWGDHHQLLLGILWRCPLHRARRVCRSQSSLSNFREKLIKPFKRLANYNFRST